ncbi:MAG: hypothetical protein KGJ06_01530 [Pseudomonadota bacterium]|nr:hypothetical protein [Pseudomonadota bacterium]
MANQAGISLSFDLDDKKQFEQLNRFGDLAVCAGVNFLPSQKLDRNATQVSVLISASTPVKSLLPVAYGMAIRSTEKPNGETHRPITQDEPEYVLTHLTGVPWKHVLDSPYYSHVVEAVLPEPADASTRAKQEFGVGIALRPSRATTRMEIDDWLKHQTQVETERGIPPRTMVPGDWVLSLGIQNAQTVEHILKNTLPKAFSKER